MALKAKGKKAIQDFIDNGTEFKHETISGQAFSQWIDVPLGRLHNPGYGELYGHKPVLVLFSYRTPIAWKFAGDDEKWEVPERHYSVTTTNHQNVARVAIDNPGFYKNSKW